MKIKARARRIAAFATRTLGLTMKIYYHFPRDPNRPFTGITIMSCPGAHAPGGKEVSEWNDKFGPLTVPTRFDENGVAEVDTALAHHLIETGQAHAKPQK